MAASITEIASANAFYDATSFQGGGLETVQVTIATTDAVLATDQVVLVITTEGSLDPTTATLDGNNFFITPSTFRGATNSSTRVGAFERAFVVTMMVLPTSVAVASGANLVVSRAGLTGTAGTPLAKRETPFVLKLYRLREFGPYHQSNNGLSGQVVSAGDPITGGSLSGDRFYITAAGWANAPTDTATPTGGGTILQNWFGTSTGRTELSDFGSGSANTHRDRALIIGWQKSAGSVGMSTAITTAQPNIGGGGVMVGFSPFAGTTLSFDRGPDRRKVLAFVDSDGALKVNLYDGALPEAVGSVVTVETDACLWCSLKSRNSAEWDLVYCRMVATVDTVYLRTSRDQGHTWGTAVTVATGYQAVTHWIDEQSGMLVAALYDTTNTKWWLTVGTLDASGTTWSWSSVVSLATSAARSGDIRRRTDGVWEFAFVTTGDVVTILTCRKLSSAGVGTWA